MNHTFSIILSILLFSCNQNSQVDRDKIIYNQIKALKTDIEKNNFLYKLWHEDQHFRGGQEGDLIAKHGFRSKEHMQFLEISMKNEVVVFYKMKTYLEIHGYPKNKSNFHELSINAFPIIIGHNHNFKAQKELLPYLYNAYKADQCALGDVVWLLGEMYEAKNGGRRYTMSSSRFTTEQEFQELVAALDLKLSL